MFASLFGHQNIVRMLIAQGADITLTDRRGLNAIDLAAQQGNKEMVDLLLSYLE